MELDQAESNNYYISKESNNSLRIENTLNYFIKSNLETKLNKKEEQNNEEFFLVVPVEVIKDITYY